jgi:beta-xylosidase
MPWFLLVRFRPYRILLLVILGVLLAGGGSGSPAMSSAGTYTNPVFAKDFPDPMILRVNAHSYYAYGTTTEWSALGTEFPILHSTDLVHWRHVGNGFPHPPSWASGDYWAPDVLYHGGLYYLYYTGLKGTHCVAAATGKTPIGPFVTRAIIGCGDGRGTGYIDPDVLIDPGGKAYLYVSVDNPEHSISVIPLKADLLHAAGPRIRLFGLTQQWEHGEFFSTVEGPFVIRQGNFYYLFYSANDWNGDYAMGYAVGRSPLGPFTKCACNPILHGTAAILGPGGGSVVEGPDARQWLLFHAWDDGGLEGYQAGGIRAMLLEPIGWQDTRAVVAPPMNAPQPMP